MNRTRALLEALSLLNDSKRGIRQIRRTGCADLGDIFLAEMRMRRVRLARLLRLVQEELRRNGGAAASSYHRNGSGRRSARPPRAA